jgi:transcriptional regulator with XRE-family HTH domain
MLGEELRKARLAAGLTQEELSFRANTHRVYISEIERSKKSPTVEALFRICDAMATKPSVILARVERQRMKETAKTRMP